MKQNPLLDFPIESVKPDHEREILALALQMIYLSTVAVLLSPKTAPQPGTLQCCERKCGPLCPTHCECRSEGQHKADNQDTTREQAPSPIGPSVR